MPIIHLYKSENGEYFWLCGSTYPYRYVIKQYPHKWDNDFKCWRCNLHDKNKIIAALQSATLNMKDKNLDIQEHDEILRSKPNFSKTPKPPGRAPSPYPRPPKPSPKKPAPPKPSQPKPSPPKPSQPKPSPPKPSPPKPSPPKQPKETLDVYRSSSMHFFYICGDQDIYTEIFEFYECTWDDKFKCWKVASKNREKLFAELENEDVELIHYDMMRSKKLPPQKVPSPPRVPSPPKVPSPPRQKEIIIDIYMSDSPDHFFLCGDFRGLKSHEKLFEYYKCTWNDKSNCWKAKLEDKKDLLEELEKEKQVTIIQHDIKRSQHEKWTWVFIN